MNIKKLFFISFLFFAISISGQNDLTETTLLNVGDNLPSFTCKTLDGKDFSSDVLKGKVVLINFWATWCPPCKAEMPLMQSELFDKIKRDDFIMLAISRGEESDIVKKFIEKNNYTFPIFLDKEAKVYNLFASKYIPRNFIIGKDGKVKFTSVGFTKEEFQKLVNVIKAELEK
ncbi:MAG: TlpA family protein disulfide reductase [Melioribacteraceae bacterium]|nr:TlpA family protein disulfide reductase [Melioribacteraceae bacterium]